MSVLTVQKVVSGPMSGGIRKGPKVQARDRGWGIEDLRTGPDMYDTVQDTYLATSWRKGTSTHSYRPLSPLTSTSKHSNKRPSLSYALSPQRFSFIRIRAYSSSCDARE